MAETLTLEQHAAIDAYWAATTPAEAKVAYKRMMDTGLPDAYGADLYIDPRFNPYGSASQRNG